MISDQDLLDQFHRDYRSAESHTFDWRMEAKELYDLIAGHQWSDVDKAKLLEDLRPMATFNIAGKYIDAMSGLQINNRQEVKFFPRETGDAQVSALLTGAAKWMRDQCDAEDEETDAFLDLIICGMGWIETYLDFRGDPEGEMKIERRDPLEMRWDTDARQRNLTDARWVQRIAYLKPEVVEERWGAEALAEIGHPYEFAPSEEFGGPIHLADEAWKYTHQAAEPDSRGSIPVVDYQWWTLDRMIQVQTKYGVKKFTPQQWKKLKEVFHRNSVKHVAQDIHTYRYFRAYLAGRTVLEKGDSPYQEGFTFQAITGKRDRNTNTWHAVGRAAKEPQQWVNKFFSMTLDHLLRNAKGGVLAEEGAFSDPQKAEAEWSRNDSITYTEAGAITQGKIMPRTPAPTPPALPQLLDFAMQSIPQTTGLNLELMGFADRVQPGVVEAQRKESAITIIAWAFNSMRKYYKVHGRQLAYYIREYLSDGRLVRISGEKGAQYVPLTRDAQTYIYDVVVDESPHSVNQKERVWLVLMDLLPALLKMGVPIPPEILDYSPLPPDLAETWKKAMQKPPSPEQQKASQLALAKEDAEVKETQTKAQLQAAQVKETEAKTVKTSAEAGVIMAGGSKTNGQSKSSRS